MAKRDEKRNCYLTPGDFLIMSRGNKVLRAQVEIA